MVCLSSLAPAATAADATGFALLKRYLDGREPALPEGCVLDVELEAKELLARISRQCQWPLIWRARAPVPERRRDTLGQQPPVEIK